MDKLYLAFVFVSTWLVMNRVIKPFIHRWGFCYWEYYRNPHVRKCKICGRKQEEFSTAGVNYFGRVVVIDRWEDI